MAKINKNILLLTIALVMAVVLIGFIYWQVRKSHIEIGPDQKIDITPEQIQSIKAIGEWEFMSISDEEMIDTIRRGIFSDDHLVRIYYGTLRLGVNLKQVEPGWITTRNDTIEMILPPIELLDRDFIDESRTKSFYESGKWKSYDREAMLKRAYQRMLQRNMTPQNMQIARENGEAQVRQVLQGMGFKHIKIQYKD